ncbi:signal peptidase I [Tissierella sp. Yu-01]|uniref:signal peptidase I n=1 Tax=Tissierella sp. Yu-01 TaxID=3035694 RepID=UPI00240D4E99|nr:signal peptidase I [Tissierella sp. Yu-01]WFA08270.1 signal peptidase I [Tissierella sp. Yu-01]
MESSLKFLPTRVSSKRNILVILLLLSIYILDNSPIVKFIDSYTFTYIIKPMLWICIAIIVWQMPQIKSKGKLRYSTLLKFWAMYFGIMYVVITVLAGLIDGLGKSPYNHTPKGILINIIFVGSALVGREFIRSYLVNSFTKKENYLVFILIALFMTVTNFSINKYSDIENLKGFVQFSAQFFIPEFSHNFFATYLVFLGGPIISLIYLGIIQSFHWLSPILPDLKWITSALVGILCPTFFLMSMQSIYLNATKQIKKREQEDESPIGWIITSIISIGIIWFAVGVFPIYPSVIATGSMEPMIYPGDVILVKKITDMEGIYNLKEGDVIQFKRDNVLISHRITELVYDEEQGLLFRTKGDNNSSEDSELVKPQDLKGTIEHVVPKVGWPTLLIKSDKNIDLNEIEF